MPYAGPNSNAVLSVIRLIEPKFVFASGPEPKLDGVSLVTDLDEACHLRFDQDGDPIFISESGIELLEIDFEEDDPDAGTLLWQDIYNRLVGDVKTAECFRWRKDNPEANDELEKIKLAREVIRTQLLEIMPKLSMRVADVIAEDVSSTLYIIALGRAVSGQAPNFWEQLFRIYSAGCWPCGFVGTWPSEGKYIAWYPTAD